MSFLDNAGVEYFWKKMKAYVASHTTSVDVSNFYYKKGDTFNLTSIPLSGTLTGAQKSLVFAIPLCKPVIGASSAKINNLKLTVRQNNKYLIGSSSAYAAPGGTVATTILANAIKVQITLPNALAGTNNDLVSVFAQGDITFN